MAKRYQQTTGQTGSIAAASGESQSLARLVLKLRGIPEAEQEEILSPEPPSLLDPFTLQDMPAAMDTLLPLIKSKGRILVHGDYDTDGVASTAILLGALRSLGCDVIAHIPNRLSDGYGLADSGVEHAFAIQADAVITCDCGVQSFDEVNRLEQGGIPVVVTDHHSCRPELPGAHAVINPNRLDETYAFHGLAGAGVALKLVQALGVSLGKPELWREFIDLAALGTVGDSMQLVGENRSIVRHGLAKLQTDPSPGLRALMAAVKIQAENCLASDLAFRMSPKINAAGRLGDSATALKLLLSEDSGEAEQLAAGLLVQNNQRREIETEAVAEAMAQLERHPDWLRHQGVVVGLKRGHAGVMGIVAARLTERLACPVVALMLDAETDPEQAFWRGSARTYGDASVLELIQAAGEHTKQFGGHPAAAGVELLPEQLDAFRQAFQEAADRLDPSVLDVDRHMAECDLGAEYLNLDSALDLARLEPFGMGNPEPLFRIRGAEITEVRRIGQDKRHLRIMARPIKGETSIPAIFFGGWDRMAAVLQNFTDAGDRRPKLDFLCKVNVNRYRDQCQLQLMVEDYSLPEAVKPEGDLGDAETEKLYRKYDSWRGAELAAILGTNPGMLLPDKALLGNLYRYLAGRLESGPGRFRLASLTSTMLSMYNIDTNDFQVRRVLDIYREAGLLEARDIGRDELLLIRRKPEGKADLYRTETWLRLAGER